MTAERPFYIYCHTAPNGKRYIGQTSVEPKKRWNNGLGYLGCTYFRHAIEKYGWENIRHDIICVVHSEKLAHLFERYYIQKYDTFNHDKGYNLTLGGEGTLGHELSEEAKRKISEANTGNFWDEERKRQWSKSNTGEGNPMYGRHHSAAVREKMSRDRKGKPLSPDHREKVTKALLEQREKQKKPIRQLDLDGNLVATYLGFSGVTEATGFGHSSIWQACNGNSDVAYGYKWEYVDEDLRIHAEQTRANRLAEKQDRICRGEGTGGMAVIQFDTDGNEIARYSSMSDAEKKTGFHRDRIGDCCHGGLESYKGYTWSFVNGGQKGAEKVPVRQSDLNGDEIATYESIADASAKTGIPRYLIRNCCRGRSKTSHGFKWEFVDDSHRQNMPKPRTAVIQFDMDGHEVGVYESLAEAMRVTGHDRHRIVECCKGERESYRGFTWRYKEAA